MVGVGALPVEADRGSPDGVLERSIGAGCSGGGRPEEWESVDFRLLENVCCFVRKWSGRSSGFSTPSWAIIFCCFVGRGLRVDSDTSRIGGGSGATGDHL